MSMANDLHSETTKIYNLPAGIYYFRNTQYGLLIGGFEARRNATENKFFSINKHTLEGAYQKVVKYLYGDKAEEVLSEYPTPYIHPSDLYVFKRIHKTYIYGISIHFSGGHNKYLAGFLSRKYNMQTYFSIRKLGLEKAWDDAVTHRYSSDDPLSTDVTEMPLEFWDMINPKYRIKTR
jgi:hypothetical protein